MYFCDSPEARIRQCDYDAESARVANVREFVRLKDGSGQPDGSIVDRDGCLWNAVWGAGMVRRYDAEGRLLTEIPVPSKNVTCVAFGGDALDQLYVTSSRQEMTAEELRAAPASGSVYHVSTTVEGICDALFPRVKSARSLHGSGFEHFPCDHGCGRGEGKQRARE